MIRGEINLINKTLAILAGGKSSRMNYNNKALLNYKEKKFIEHIISAGSNFKEIIIVSNEKELYNEFGLKVIEDEFKGKGPLAGIHSVLKNSTTDYTLCIACDMPLIKTEVIEYMGNYDENYDVLIPKYENELQPLCAIYSKRLKDKIEDDLINDRNKLKKFVMSVNYKVIDGIGYRKFNEQDFMNINTPVDYENLESI